jgi:hypothetical protein
LPFRQLRSAGRIERTGTYRRDRGKRPRKACAIPRRGGKIGLSQRIGQTH